MEKIVIPELEGYFGCKGAAGVFQNIINRIPPHETLIIPFLGYCAIYRNMRPAREAHLNDLDPKVADLWRRSPAIKGFGGNASVYNYDYAAFLSIIQKSGYDKQSAVIYMDPPYMHDVRASAKDRYNFELSPFDHLHMLSCARRFKKARVLISCYDNDVYARELDGWSKVQFPAMTRGGVTTETLYFNYDPPNELHDYRYYGANYRERENNRLKRKRLLAKFEAMSAADRHYYFDALREDFPEHMEPAN
ncbi:phage DNA methylase [Robiginitalea biformata]|uniref:site-specific DNA-methyltransferase (adenine-specific) n=1 Tax=Robiginitalea biformata (strain ATCC BAA-864 / DSM 15991 / KCTC 12146 / HTCC2501) TaxID=313596 RepID=A4CKQ8_ROBBH|nr:phage DNA methylase [Robiginitalea biformata]EAR15457.1 phage DNA methylase [Robiginitalea biformata HTCC2501]